MTGPVASHDDVLSKLRAALAPHGVFLRGVVTFTAGEGAPVLKDGQVARSVVLLGNAGGSIWLAFERWRKDTLEGGGENPLDTWSKTVIGPVAQRLGATAYFPSDPPWQPFQQWAMRAEGLKASPLGILIHPEYGLWHGYRGALGFDHALAPTMPDSRAHPCDECSAKPCLSSCPADAVLSSGFQVSPCRAHLKTREGQAGCMAGGCRARNACPVGVEHRYSTRQLRFHMAALGL
ncbi:ferredoxin [Pararhizobium polonicum]|uniref:Ferredoxin n=1 Tax=Pararhizobium polonicum TaxID=1612624 RepID=A0A1C7NXZ3_9HYPH|nr:4Fe-4S dicluster domain-containing protein [Pararhizobium polonicum]OBZ93871.1 ferredoxin [Pararhizobium polonicum]